MNGWLLGVTVLLIGGLAPALWLACTGGIARRLVGLELAGAITVLAMVLVAQGFSQPVYLIVPAVLVLLSFAGTLVYTRLLGVREEEP